MGNISYHNPLECMVKDIPCPSLDPRQTSGELNIQMSNLPLSLTE